MTRLSTTRARPHGGRGSRRYPPGEGQRVVGRAAMQCRRFAVDHSTLDSSHRRGPVVYPSVVADASVAITSVVIRAGIGVPTRAREPAYRTPDRPRSTARECRHSMTRAAARFGVVSGYPSARSFAASWSGPPSRPAAPGRRSGAIRERGRTATWAGGAFVGSGRTTFCGARSERWLAAPIHRRGQRQPVVAGQRSVGPEHPSACVLRWVRWPQCSSGRCRSQRVGPTGFRMNGSRVAVTALSMTCTATGALPLCLEVVAARPSI